MRLLCHPLRKVVVRFRIETSGINKPEVEIAYLYVRFVAVARDAGRVVDNGGPAAHQTVEERGFADIRAADDSNGGQHDRTASRKVSINARRRVVRRS